MSLVMVYTKPGCCRPEDGAFELLHGRQEVSSVKPHFEPLSRRRRGGEQKDADVNERA